MKYRWRIDKGAEPAKVVEPSSVPELPLTEPATAPPATSATPESAVEVEATPQAYGPEVVGKLVAMVRRGRTPETLEREFGPPADTIREWVAAAEAARASDAAWDWGGEEEARVRWYAWQEQNSGWLAVVGVLALVAVALSGVASLIVAAILCAQTL